MSYEFYIDSNGIAICNDCSQKYQIFGQVVKCYENEVVYCENCQDTIV